jgi:hypothetical protein
LHFSAPLFWGVTGKVVLKMAFYFNYVSSLAKAVNFYERWDAESALIADGVLQVSLLLFFIT